MRIAKQVSFPFAFSGCVFRLHFPARIFVLFLFYCEIFHNAAAQPFGYTHRNFVLFLEWKLPEDPILPEVKVTL